MNSFTLEASFSQYISKDRISIDLTTEMFERMGELLGDSFYEYVSLVEEDEKQRHMLKQKLLNK
eukprot:CAMPEP_0170562626 /NCGR_PEP_ID=MMETSP0211-20121228/61584_1 /TAXON_ID=311385 /ORGANISM="Pseudokeronopsis sp., Strain OXSARD2" /LENGTH=63 /DNA_ID=CAMNT_0010879737 /DNA_START=131 /DNA_END=322 /DNA_ORIENTATION=+